MSNASGNGSQTALLLALPAWAKSLPDDAGITCKELAEVTGCTEQSIRQAVHSKFLPPPRKVFRGTKHKARWNFRVGDIKAAIKIIKKAQKAGLIPHTSGGGK